MIRVEEVHASVAHSAFKQTSRTLMLPITDGSTLSQVSWLPTLDFNQ